MRYAYWIWFAMIALWASGCATLTQTQAVKMPDSPEVTRILQSLSQANADLLSYKGTGKLMLRKGDGVQVVRAAWTGVRPDKIRIIIQGITGFPIAGMAADGSWLYLMSYSQDSYFKEEVHNPNLKKLVSIPVTAADVISLLSGVVPIRQYQSSILMPMPAQSGYVLSLMGKRGIDIEKIYLDQTRMQVLKIEMFTPEGQPAFRVEFGGESEFDGFRVPERFVFSDDNGVGFQLDVDKFWPNAPVSPDMFVISPQG